MGLFTRVRPDGPTRRPTVVLRAAGARIDLRDRESIKHLVGTKQAWQTDAWIYRDLIPELRFGGKFVANAIGRVKFIPAMVNADGDDPVPFWKKPEGLDPALAQAAADELARLPFHSGTKFQGRMAENVDVAGECWLHGYLDSLGRERWEVLSVDEVQIAPDGVITLKNDKGQIRHQVNPAQEEMIRLWVQHPRYSDYADSPLRALQDVCSEIVLNGRERRAVSRSRAAANGILLVPEGMSLSSATQDDPGDADSNGFMGELQGAMLAPINNEGDPGAVVPMLIQGAPDDLKEIRQVRLEREDSEVILAKLDNAIGRLGTGLDIPREILSGMGDSNHWSAWQIDASTYRYHIDPRCRVLADAITEGFLWPALMARGQFTVEQISQIQVWFDASNLTENPNRTQDAKDAYDRVAIGGKTLRDALGFTDEDAPTDDEAMRQIALKSGVDPITSGLLLQRILEPNKSAIYPTREQVTDRGAILDQTGKAVTPVAEALPASPASGHDGQTPNAVPSTGQDAAPPSVTASALVAALLAAGEPPTSWRMSTDESRRLMDIEHSLRDRLVTAADAAMARVLEKAGSRVRSRTNGKPELKAKLDGHEVEAFAAILGSEQVLALGLDLDALLAGAFDELRRKFLDWTTLGIANVARTVVKMLGLSEADGKRATERIEQEMGARTEGAWRKFQVSLRSLAAKHLYAPPGVPERGEHVSGHVPTGVVRAALVEIGGPLPGSGGVTEHGHAPAGGPPGGLALGETVTAIVHEYGGQDVGYEWVYGITPLEREFHPHRDIDGLRFATFSDPKLSTALDPRGAWVGPFFFPGDHSGCLCDYSAVWAIPDRKVAEQAAQENSENAKNDRALADRDLAAGRYDTDAVRSAAERERIQELQQRFIDRN